MNCHEIDYEIAGDDLQYVIVELDKGETVIGEAGTMMFMEPGIRYESKMGDGSNPSGDFFSKVLSAGKRLITGESLFLTHFTNTVDGKKHVAFAGTFPGKILPIDLGKLSSDLVCQKDGFLCAAYGTKIDIEFTKKIGAGLFGGEGFILQKIIGDGLVFLNAGGGIYEKELQNETLYIDTGCIVAFEKTISYDIERAGNLKTMIFGGEGIFLAKLTGTGRIWVQSLPFSRLAGKIVSSAGYSSGKEEGSILGKIGNLFEQ